MGGPARTVERAAGTAFIAATNRDGQPLSTAVTDPSTGPAGGADLRLLGELDLATAPVLERLLQAQIDRGHRLDELDVFKAMLATFETGAHLVLLAAQGHLRRTSVDGVDHYAT